MTPSDDPRLTPGPDSPLWLTAKYGRLSILRRLPSPQGNRRGTIVACRCACGVECSVPLRKVLSGNTKSCGCWKVDAPKPRAKHGHAGNGRIGKPQSPEYQIWAGVKKRCLNSKNKNYKDYGGRGVKICERWSISFLDFLADVGPRPSPKHSIERIDVNGNYEPGNVKWIPVEEQQLNKRNTHLVHYQGKSMPLSVFCRLPNSSGISPYTVKSRIAKGWSPERALTA